VIRSFDDFDERILGPVVVVSRLSRRAPTDV
jgi:hypothetical protein